MVFGNAFGEVLRSLRKKQKLTQEDLAERCDSDRVVVSNWENGKRVPLITTVFRIAKALELSPSELIKEIEEHLITKEK